MLILASLNYLTGCKNGKSAGDANSDVAENDTMRNQANDKWLIDITNVELGCDRPDCIKSIDDPKFISVAEADFLSDDDLVIGIKLNDEIKCYPHAILNWHEIVNDKIDDKNFAVNYCPLTGSGMAWNREINGRLTTFGISGLLYNSNVMPYDRETESAWSQMKQLCVNGELAEQRPQTMQVIETTWNTWKKLYPDSRVLSTETGMSRDYSSYPYDTYRENEDVYFYVENDNDTLHPKERLFGIIENEQAKCYRFDLFKPGVKVLNDTAFGKNIILIGSERDNFITAFENPSEQKFVIVKNKLPALFQDEEGNMYDIFGYCVEGNKKSERLNPANGFTAYWFAWAAFYPKVVLY
jgi:hypothetical protein